MLNVFLHPCPPYFLIFEKIYICLFIVYDAPVRVWVCPCHGMSGDQSTSCENHFSLSTMKTPGIKLESLGLAANAFPHWAILPVLHLILEAGSPQHSELAVAARNGWLGNSSQPVSDTQCQDCRHMPSHGAFFMGVQGTNSGLQTCRATTLSTNPSYMPWKDIFNVTYVIAITLCFILLLFVQSIPFFKIYINLHNSKGFTLLFNFFSQLKVIFRLVWCVASTCYHKQQHTDHPHTCIFLSFFVSDRVSLHSPGSPETHWVYTCILNFARVSI